MKIRLLCALALTIVLLIGGASSDDAVQPVHAQSSAGSDGISEPKPMAAADRISQ